MGTTTENQNSTVDVIMTQKLTKRQAEVLEAYKANGYNKRATAEKLGITRQSVQNAITAIERKGLAPWRIKGAITPDTRKVGKITTQYGAGGKIEREWVRTEPIMEQLGDFVNDLCKQVKGKSRVKVRAPLRFRGSLARNSNSYAYLRRRKLLCTQRREFLPLRGTESPL